MKILCFSDLHCDRDAATKLVSLAADVDVVIGAGDFANRHKGLSDTLDILCQIDKPAVLVPGNGETADELRQATKSWRSATVLHGNGCEIDDVSYWGVGGGIPVTPFGDWSYDFDETQAGALLSGCPDHAILVVHSPPIDTVDHDSSGRIRGSQAIRDTVMAKNPRLVVCGHIHSDWGNRVTLGQTTILNAGPSGIVIDLASPGADG
ncbi:metallophosphoesterase family protein [Rubripirellula reticaptiva]|uniref:Calcineurin-like phosphoesterase superfamily domain protein n=1 Tax=Rubripirellula reticaptiva TaxID=2528013 RepID=A0A5C6F7I9_9BACT|nr:metallophosphoesterase [Rubripirellula reticaptiva]TWU55739.1 Calcineurin-like phosphoesterase superfamily domain protein [Rubripirellula reticaptiva]